MRRIVTEHSFGRYYKLAHKVMTGRQPNRRDVKASRRNFNALADLFETDNARVTFKRRSGAAGQIRVWFKPVYTP